MLDGSSTRLASRICSTSGATICRPPRPGPCRGRRIVTALASQHRERFARCVTRPGSTLRTAPAPTSADYVSGASSVSSARCDAENWSRYENGVTRARSRRQGYKPGPSVWYDALAGGLSATKRGGNEDPLARAFDKEPSVDAWGRSDAHKRACCPPAVQIWRRCASIVRSRA